MLPSINFYKFHNICQQVFFFTYIRFLINKPNSIFINNSSRSSILKHRTVLGFFFSILNPKLYPTYGFFYKTNAGYGINHLNLTLTFFSIMSLLNSFLSFLKLSNCVLGYMKNVLNFKITNEIQEYSQASGIRKRLLSFKVLIFKGFDKFIFYTFMLSILCCNIAYMAVSACSTLLPIFLLIFNFNFFNYFSDIRLQLSSMVFGSFVYSDIDRLASNLFFCGFLISSFIFATNVVKDVNNTVRSFDFSKFSLQSFKNLLRIPFSDHQEDIKFDNNNPDHQEDIRCDNNNQFKFQQLTYLKDSSPYLAYFTLSYLIYYFDQNRISYIKNTFSDLLEFTSLILKIPVFGIVEEMPKVSEKIVMEGKGSIVNGEDYFPIELCTQRTNNI